MRHLSALGVVAVSFWAGCSLGTDPPPNVVTARFDPQAQVIPLPNDLVQDQSTHLLALPVDQTQSPAEQELRNWMNQLDGWPTTFAGSSLFSGPLDGAAWFRVNLVMVTRTAMVPYYRSDAMHLERLHWEAAVDQTPESLAADLREL